MKKNNQMKPDNVAKRLWAFFIVLTMCITVQPVVPVKAQEAVQTAARTIYTEFKDGICGSEGRRESNTRADF